MWIVIYQLCVNTCMDTYRFDREAFRICGMCALVAGHAPVRDEPLFPADANATVVLTINEWCEIDQETSVPVLVETDSGFAISPELYTLSSSHGTQFPRSAAARRGTELVTTAPGSPNTQTDAPLTIRDKIKASGFTCSAFKWIPCSLFRSAGKDATQ